MCLNVPPLTKILSYFAFPPHNLTNIYELLSILYTVEIYLD